MKPSTSRWCCAGISALNYGVLCFAGVYRRVPANQLERITSRNYVTHGTETGEYNSYVAFRNRSGKLFFEWIALFSLVEITLNFSTKKLHLATIQIYSDDLGACSTRHHHRKFMTRSFGSVIS